MTTRRQFLQSATATIAGLVLPKVVIATPHKTDALNQLPEANKNLTVTHIHPKSRQTGEFTFAVVDQDKKASVAFYPASQLENGVKSTPEEVLTRFHSDQKHYAPQKHI